MRQPGSEPTDSPLEISRMHAKVVQCCSMTCPFELQMNFILADSCNFMRGVFLFLLEPFF